MGQNCLLFNLENLWRTSIKFSKSLGISKRLQERFILLNLTHENHKILWQGPSFPLRRIPEPSPEPPQRQLLTNNQRHKLPNLTILYYIVYGRQCPIRHIYTHRMLRNGLHLKPDIVPTKVKRPGRAPRRLRLDFHHFFQQIEKEHLVLETDASLFADLLKPKMAVSMRFLGFDGHRERSAWPSFS